MSKINQEKILECALAILAETLHNENRVWKNMDWGLLDELHNRGWIFDPVNKKKSISLTEMGLKNVEIFRQKHFTSVSQTSSTRTSAKSKIIEQTLDTIDFSTAHTVRCTGKLLKELRVKPEEVESNEENSVRDWHANLLMINRRKCILVTHSLSLYSFFIYGVNRKMLDDFTRIFNSHMRAQLKAEGIYSPVLYDRFGPEVDTIITKSNSRSVLGSMNELAFLLENAVWDLDSDEFIDEVDLANKINHTPMSAIELTWPPRELRSILSKMGG